MNVAPLHLSHTHDGKVALLRLDHGKANEMGSDCLAAFEALCDHLESAEGPVVLVTYSTRTTSKGTPVFVAGANVSERVGWDDERVKAHVSWQRHLLTRLRRAPVFHVVIASGVALGWGTEYLLTADWRIATNTAVFGLPETGLGIVPGAGGTSELWTEIGVGHALRLGMTGERIGAEEAVRIGLVHEQVVDLEAALKRADALADLVTKKSPTAIAAFKRGVLASVGVPAEARTSIEADAYATCVDTGQAAVGRTAFDAIRKGEAPAWGPRHTG